MHSNNFLIALHMSHHQPFVYFDMRLHYVIGFRRHLYCCARKCHAVHPLLCCGFTLMIVQLASQSFYIFPQRPHGKNCCLLSAATVARFSKVCFCNCTDANCAFVSASNVRKMNKRSNTTALSGSARHSFY